MKIKLADGRKVDLNGPEHLAEVHRISAARQQAEAERANMATDRQISYLRDLGVDVPAGLTKSAASRLISEAKMGRAGGFLGYGEDHGDDAVRPHPYEGNLNNEAY